MEHHRSQEDAPKDYGPLLDQIHSNPRIDFDPHEVAQGLIAEGWGRVQSAYQSYLGGDHGDISKTRVFQALEDLYLVYYLSVTKSQLRAFQRRAFHVFFDPILNMAMKRLDQANLRQDSFEPFFKNLWSDPLRERAHRIASWQPFR